MAAGPKAYVANGTIRRARFVKVDPSDNNSVLEADANERVIGISQLAGRTAPIPSVTADPPEAAQSGEFLTVHNQGESGVLLELGTGGATAGGLLKSDADGKGVAIATTGTTIQQIGARALETASAGELCKVEIVIFSERPALA